MTTGYKDVYEVIIAANGLTSRQIAAKMDRKLTSVRPRISELLKDGMIRHAGRAKRTKGPPAYIWVRA